MDEEILNGETYVIYKTIDISIFSAKSIEISAINLNITI